jgi:hypothetical protein
MSRALTTLLMFALQGAAWAGPVPAGEVDTAPAASTLPSLSPRVSGDVAPADAAASAPSVSALAVEIIKEAEAGVAVAEAPRGPRRDSARAMAPPPAPSPGTRNQPSTGDDPWGLRDIRKTAVQWVKEAVPWLRSDEDRPDASQNMTLDSADWSASPLEGGQTGRGARLASNPPSVAGPGVDSRSAVGYGDSARPRVVDPEGNLVSVVINVLREVLEHPMTWLVLSLFVIGGIVVKKIDRRPTK